MKITKTNEQKVKKSGKRLQGIVESNKMNNTIVVSVEIKFAHPLYKKIVTSHKRYLVHCVVQDIKEGDIVTIQEGKPVSKNKNFYFIEKLTR